jgi:hypothetical protein
MDNVQLRSGKLTYFPKNSDVQFSLEVSLDDKHAVSESVRVLLSGLKTANEKPEPTGGAGRIKTPQSGSRQADLISRVSGYHDVTARTEVRVHRSAPLRKPELPIEMPCCGSPPEIPLDTVQNAVSLPFPTLNTAAPPKKVAQSAGKNPDQVPQSATSGDSASAINGESSSSFMPEAIKAGTYVPPKPIREVMPNTKLFGSSIVVYDITQIPVQVHVDQTGHVTSAAVAKNRTKNSLLTSVCVAAAKQWIFEPAIMNGKSVPAAHTIVFEFHPNNP